MGAPAYLNSSFHYLYLPNVSDVQDVIDAFEDEVLNQLSTPWTTPSTGLYKSPVNSVYRWFDVLLTRTDATTLQVRLRDQNGYTIYTGRIFVDVGGIVRIWTGECHWLIQADRTTPECIGGGLLDTSPDRLDSHPWTIYMNPVHRATDNSVIESKAWAAPVTSFGVNYEWRGEQINIPNRGTPYLRSAGGSLIFRPVHYWNQSAGILWGRRFQAILVDGRVGTNTEFTVPIADGEYGVFQVTGVAADYTNDKLAMRVA